MSEKSILNIFLRQIVIITYLFGKISTFKIYPNFYNDRKQIRKDHKGKTNKKKLTSGGKRI